MSKESTFCTTPKSKPKRPLEGKSQREARLLRENLKKRKIQARLRTAAVEENTEIKMDSE